MKNYEQIRQEAWAAIKAARQQKEKDQSAAEPETQKEAVHFFDSPKALMEHLMNNKSA